MRRKIPSTQALICFEAAAKHESYTKASEELALTQSAVSRQISLLETFLGLKLFRRTRHGVSLTPAGQAYARQVTQRLQGLERDAFEALTQQGTGGHLTLAAVPTFTTHWLIPKLGRLAQQHPEITVHIDTRTRPFLFADSAFDAALYTGTPEQIRNWPGTRADKLMDETVVPVCSPALLPQGHELTPEGLRDLPLLQQSTRPDGWRHWFDAQQVDVPQAGRGPRYELFSMLAMAATHGMGVALMPLLLIRGELARGELVVACPRPLGDERAYYLITPETSAGNPALERFRSWVLQEAADASRF